VPITTATARAATAAQMATGCAGSGVTHGAGGLAAVAASTFGDGFPETRQVVPFAATRATSAPRSADVAVVGAAAVVAATAFVVVRSCRVASSE